MAVQTSSNLGTTTSTTSWPGEPNTGESSNATDAYEEFIFVLAPTILAIAVVMCCARLLFVYCSYRREHIHARARRSGTYRRHTSVAQLQDHEEQFTAARAQGVILRDPPPSYDTIFKPEFAPPDYATAQQNQRGRANSDPTSSRHMDVSISPPERVTPGRRPVTVIHVPLEERATAIPTAPTVHQLSSSREHSASISTQSTVVPVELRPEHLI